MQTTTCKNNCLEAIFLIIKFVHLLAPSIWTALQERFKITNHNEGLCDIYDGKEYKKHSAFLSQPGNVSFTLNTDGIAMYRSSSISIWPVWLVINELPKTMR